MEIWEIEIIVFVLNTGPCIAQRFGCKEGKWRYVENKSFWFCNTLHLIFTNFDDDFHILKIPKCQIKMTWSFSTLIIEWRELLHFHSIRKQDAVPSGQRGLSLDVSGHRGPRFHGRIRCPEGFASSPKRWKGYPWSKNILSPFHS